LKEEKEYKDLPARIKEPQAAFDESITQFEFTRIYYNGP